MFTLKIENTKGSILELTNNETDFQITNIDGLNPPNANINTSNYANNDGSSFNGSKIENRQIVITIALNGNIERNRLLLYKYFKNKEWCKIYYKTELRNVFIEGYVQIFEAPQFTQKQVAQIAILCPDPYFKDLDEIVTSISKIIKKFTFPFTININNPIPFSNLDIEKVTNVVNDSESDTGLIINVTFLGDVNKLEIRNTDNGKNLIIEYQFEKNDKLVINCNKGKKSVILTRNAVDYNLVPQIKGKPTFFQLGIGDNHYSFLADDGEKDMLVDIRFKYYKVYLGV